MTLAPTTMSEAEQYVVEDDLQVDEVGNGDLAVYEPPAPENETALAIKDGDEEKGDDHEHKHKHSMSLL